jgi:hypothetical protein
VETDAECKQGVDIGHDGRWGYSLAVPEFPIMILVEPG